MTGALCPFGQVPRASGRAILMESDSANQLTLDLPITERLLPAFYALDGFKGMQKVYPNRPRIFSLVIEELIPQMCFGASLYSLVARRPVSLPESLPATDGLRLCGFDPRISE